MPDCSMLLPETKSMTFRTPALVCCLIVSLCGIGCGLTDSAEPVATAAVGLNRTRVPLGGPLEMTYRFTVAADAPAFAEDYRVFVHFLDGDGELMFTDDHEPSESSRGWEQGQEITYERRMIVPVYPYIGEVTVAVGLYSPGSGDRLLLAAEHLGQRAYRVATMQMAPQSESGFLVFAEGWHDSERVPEDPGREWRWTMGRAVLSFRNPRADSTLYLEVDGRPELFDAPQILTLAIGDTVVETLELSSEEPTYHMIAIPAVSLAEAETVTLSLNVEPSFVPAVVTGGQSADDRELGMQVFYAFLESR